MFMSVCSVWYTELLARLGSSLAAAPEATPLFRLPNFQLDQRPPCRCGENIMSPRFTVSKWSRRTVGILEAQCISQLSLAHQSVVLQHCSGLPMGYQMSRPMASISIRGPTLPAAARIMQFHSDFRPWTFTSDSPLFEKRFGSLGLLFGRDVMAGLPLHTARLGSSLLGSNFIVHFGILEDESETVPA